MSLVKTAPLTHNSPRLVHATQDTGAVQIFGLTAENYPPETVARCARMEREPVEGYSITLLKGGQAPRDLIVFTVERGGTSLTMNSTSYDVTRRRLTLITKLPSAEPEEASLIADMAQSVAIGLLLPEFPKLP